MNLDNFLGGFLKSGELDVNVNIEFDILSLVYLTVAILVSGGLLVLFSHLLG